MNNIRVEPMDKGGLMTLIGGMLFLFFVVFVIANICIGIEGRHAEIAKLSAEVSYLKSEL